MSSRRLMPALAVLLVLGACTGVSSDVAAPAPPPSAEPPIDEPPVEEPSVAEPPAEPGGDAPMPELPPMVANWHTDATVTLPNGWVVESCEGDAPLLCVVDGERQVGFLELGTYPLPEGYDGDASAYLAAAADDFVASMRDDRAAGCPDLTFEPTPAIDAVVAGWDGIRGGFRMVDDTGREVERHLLYWTVADEHHVAVTVPAYGEGGCLEPMGEFNTEDLGLVALYLDRLVADTPLPEPTTDVG